MVGYTLIHVREHERSEGITPLDGRENITGHLISELRSVWPYRDEIMSHHYLSVSSVSLIYQEKELVYIRMTCYMPYINSDIKGKGLYKIVYGQ